MVSAFAFTVVAFTAFTNYKTLEGKRTVANLMLDENIEALTANESKRPCLFRVFPCYHTSGTECVFSSNEQREVCCSSTYC